MALFVLHAKPLKVVLSQAGKYLNAIIASAKPPLLQEPCSIRQEPLFQSGFGFIFFMATSKKGVSMLYLQQQLRISSYKTVWNMGHKIRQGMAARNALYALRGVVEVDEIFVGGKQSLEDRRKFGNNKTAFFMGVEEDISGGPRFVTFEQIESICATQILPALEKSVEKGSKLISDGEGAYVMAQKEGYEHERYIESKDPEIAHEMLKWVNTLTSNLKRFLLSTHHGVYPKYRKAYLTLPFRTLVSTFPN